MMANILKKKSKNRKVLPSWGSDLIMIPTNSLILLTLLIDLSGLKTLSTLRAFKDGKVPLS